MISILRENKKLDVYKTLVVVLGEYSDKFPATSADNLFNQAVQNGVKVLPDDKRAVQILGSIVSGGASVPAKVQELLNVRYVDLAIDIRPLHKKGDKTYVAFWYKEGNVYDKVIDMVGFDGKGSGYWSDASGKKVKLISL